MVGLIGELETAGWCDVPQPARQAAFDERLTRAGSALVSRITKLIPVLDAEVGQGLTGSEQHMMVELLQQMASTLQLRHGIHPHLFDPPAQRSPSGPAGDPRPPA
jgi:hypothetical protein